MTITLFLTYSGLVSFITLILSFIFFLMTKKNGVIDLFWGLGITTAILFLTHWFGFATTETRLIQFFVLLWGCRLCVFFINRLLKEADDRRYQQLIKTSAIRLMIKQCFIQAPLQVLIVFTIYPFMHPLTAGQPIILISSILFLIGFIGESIADYQLNQFKKSKTGICDIGLWKFSRHPNYFFECLIWFSIAVMSFNSAFFILSFIGPLSIFLIMFFITGPYTEKCSLEKHGDLFKQYQSKTSYFFPWKQKS